MHISDFLSRLNSVEGRGPQYYALCPAHDDRRQSLSVKQDGERILLKCHAGCRTEDIVSSLGLRMSDLFVNDKANTNRLPSIRKETPAVSTDSRINAKYPYRDKDGALLYEVVRYEPKRFAQRRPAGDNTWVWGLGETPRVLYRLPELLAAPPEDLVFVVEGERDVERLAGEGLVATCNSGGAGKWRGEFSSALEGRDVVIIPDNDDAGRRHADQVASLLEGVAARIRVLALPDLPEKGDVSDWLDAGNSREELLALVETAPEWTPERPSETIAALREKVAETLRSSLPAQQRNETIASEVSDWLLDRERLLIDVGQDGADGGRPYIVGDEGGIWPLDKANTMVGLLLHKIGLNRTEKSYRFVVDHLEMEARANGQRVTLRRWCYQQGGTVYISCGPTHLARAHDGHLKRQLLPNGTDGVWFAADACIPTWQPSEPVDPLSLPAFRPNLTTPPGLPGFTLDVQRLLLASWPAILLSGVRPLPTLLLFGPKGGGKSTAERAILRVFLGPEAQPCLPTNDPRDFWVLATTSPIVGYDNVDGEVQPWFGDVLAATITGARDARRRLYTDDGRIDRPATAGTIITTRTASFMRPDLADRSVVIYTTEFEDADRAAESDLMAAVDAHRDGLLSWYVETASALLAQRHEAPSLSLRLVDYGQMVWAYVTKTADSVTATRAVQSLRLAQYRLQGDMDPLATAILENWPDLAPEGWWQGNTSDLRDDLEELGVNVRVLGRGRAVANAVREAKTTLALEGVRVREDVDRQGHVTFTISADNADSEKPAA